MNEILEKLNNYFGERPGLLPILGVLLIIINLLLQFIPGPGSGWFVDGNILLHLGVIFSIVGMLLIRALT